MELGQGIYDAEGRVAEALEGIIVDISELKRRETQIKYLNQRLNRIVQQEVLLKKPCNGWKRENFACIDHDV